MNIFSREDLQKLGLSIFGLFLFSVFFLHKPEVRWSTGNYTCIVFSFVNFIYIIVKIFYLITWPAEEVSNQNSTDEIVITTTTSNFPNNILGERKSYNSKWLSKTGIVLLILNMYLYLFLINDLSQFFYQAKDILFSFFSFICIILLVSPIDKHLNILLTSTNTYVGQLFTLCVLYITWFLLVLLSFIPESKMANINLATIYLIIIIFIIVFRNDEYKKYQLWIYRISLIVLGLTLLTYFTLFDSPDIREIKISILGLLVVLFFSSLKLKNPNAFLINNVVFTSSFVILYFFYHKNDLMSAFQLYLPLFGIVENIFSNNIIPIITILLNLQNIFNLIKNIVLKNQKTD